MSQRNHARTNRTRRIVRKLAAYAAGGAALVAVDANAAIIHTDLGPGGIPLAGLDLNNDGASEFEFRTEFTSWTFGCSTTSSGSTYCGTSNGGGHATDYLLQGMRGNRVVLVDGQSALIRAMPDGAPVRFDLSAGAKGNLASYWTSQDANGGCEFGCTSLRGNFVFERRAFVGLLLDLDGAGPRAGWADIETVGDYGDYVLHGYAYESEIGKPIAAGAVPEPPSLVLLAAGATGLGLLRRKRSSTRAESAASGR